MQMDKIELNVSHVNETRYSVTLSEDQLKKLIVEAVANGAGISLGYGDVTVEQCYITSRDTSTGIQREAKCTLVVDHSPRACDPVKARA